MAPGIAGAPSAVGFTAELDEAASGRAGMRGLLDGFYGKLRGELSGAEGDPSFVPPKPAVVDRPCPRCEGATAVLLERGRLVLACRTCPDPAELAWAPKKAKRRAARQEVVREGGFGAGRGGPAAAGALRRGAAGSGRGSAGRSR